MPERPRNNVAFTVVVTALSVVGGLAVMGIVGLSGAPSIVLLATALAVLPVGPLVFCFLWLDRYEPEPRMLLASGLAWGAFVATAAAVLLSGVGGYVAGLSQQASLTVVAPVVEEATKGFFLLLLLWWRRHELDGVLDGLVYAGMVGIGFAFVENILYLAASYTGGDAGPGGAEGVAATFLVRGLVSPFAHPLFTAFTGIGVGIAVSSRSMPVRLAAPPLGYLLAVGVHAVWNGSTVSGQFLVVYAGIMFPALLLVVGFAVWMRHSERRMLAAALADAADRGFLPASDIGWITDLGARRRSRSWVRAHQGPQAERALRDYQQAAVELGFLHHRYLRGTPPVDFASRGQQHVARIRAARPYFSFPGQVVPAR